MHIITRKVLVDFWNRYPDAEEPLKAWFSLMKAGRFRDSHEVRTQFGSADFLGGGKTVFDIGGNKFRLVAVILYPVGRVYVKYVLTHAEYDRLWKAGKL